MQKSIIEKMNNWGSEKTPFLFIIDFETNNPLVFPLDDIPQGILFKINKKKNYRKKKIKKKLDFNFIKSDFNTYQKSFNHVIKEINLGNSYLLNLCTRTEVVTNYSLKEVFHASSAKYKLFIDYKKHHFTVFSPEIFIQIRKNRIYSHPMKGTIDADIIDAEEKLLQNPKEQAEHFTIVDLIRNDLSMVSKEVRVKKYRYLDRLQTNKKTLLHTSSIISGKLPDDYHHSIGDILNTLLPAGSISGAPKRKTIEIINQTEVSNRGYYTGVMGYFDGERLDAGIMIRFIEQVEDKFYYRSGGGITYRSDCTDEYNELNHKIYVPID